MTMMTAVRILPMLAAVVALGAARRRSSFRPVAAFLLAVGAASLTRGLLRYAVPALALARVPASVPRLVLRADQALSLTWPAAVVALGLAVCLAHRARPALVAWAAALAVLVLPALRGAVAAELYAVLSVAALAFLAGAVAAWSGRDKVPAAEQAAVVLVLVFDVLAFVSTRGDTHALWPSALACYAVLYASLAVLSGVTWICSPPRS